MSAALIIIFLAILFMVACLIERPCRHSDVVDLGDGDGICCRCDEALRLENR